MSSVCAVVTFADGRRLSLLFDAVRSVRSQTIKGIPVYIINDSVMESMDIRKMLRQLGLDATLVEGPHAGNVADSRNVGYAYVRNKYGFVAFLDDDDLWLPSKAETQLRYLALNPEVTAVGTGAVVLNTDANVRKGDEILRPGITLTMVARDNPFVFSSIMIRTAAHPFDVVFDNHEDIKYWDDYEFVLREALDGNVGMVPEYLTVYRVHVGQATEKMVADNQDCKQRYLLVKYGARVGLNVRRIMWSRALWFAFQKARRRREVMSAGLLLAVCGLVDPQRIVNAVRRRRWNHSAL